MDENQKVTETVEGTEKSQRRLYFRWFLVAIIGVLGLYILINSFLFSLRKPLDNIIVLLVSVAASIYFAFVIFALFKCNKKTVLIHLIILTALIGGWCAWRGVVLVIGAGGFSGDTRLCIVDLVFSPIVILAIYVYLIKKAKNRIV